MAHSESEKYYESEKVLPKIDQSDFCIIPSFNVERDTTLIINHLKSLEPIYHEHIKVNNGKPDARVCNEIWFSVVKIFEHQYDICVIYNEVIDYFGFDNVLFFSNLNASFKRKLKEALGKRIPLDTFERMKIKDEASQGGAFMPSFMNIINKKK